MFTDVFPKGAPNDGTAFISCEVDGFEARAYLHIDDSPCEPNDSTGEQDFWPSLDPDDDGFIGAGKTERDLEQANALYDAWLRDEWYYGGISVEIFFRGYRLTEKLRHAYWGIKCDYPESPNGNEDITREANEILPSAIAEAKELLDECLSNNFTKEA